MELKENATGPTLPAHMRRDLETLLIVRKIILHRKHHLERLLEKEGGNVNFNSIIDGGYMRNKSWVSVKEKVHRYEKMLQVIKETENYLKRLEKHKGVVLKDDIKNIIRELEKCGHIKILTVSDAKPEKGKQAAEKNGQAVGKIEVAKKRSEHRKAEKLTLNPGPSREANVQTSAYVTQEEWNSSAKTGNDRTAATKVRNQIKVVSGNQGVKNNDITSQHDIAKSPLRKSATAAGGSKTTDQNLVNRENPSANGLKSKISERKSNDKQEVRQSKRSDHKPTSMPVQLKERVKSASQTKHRGEKESEKEKNGERKPGSARSREKTEEKHHSKRSLSKDSRSSVRSTSRRGSNKSRQRGSSAKDKRHDVKATPQDTKKKEPSIFKFQQEKQAHQRKQLPGGDGGQRTSTGTEFPRKESLLGASDDNKVEIKISVQVLDPKKSSNKMLTGTGHATEARGRLPVTENLRSTQLRRSQGDSLDQLLTRNNNARGSKVTTTLGSEGTPSTERLFAATNSNAKGSRTTVAGKEGAVPLSSSKPVSDSKLKPGALPGGKKESKLKTGSNVPQPTAVGPAGEKKTAQGPEKTPQPAAVGKNPAPEKTGEALSKAGEAHSKETPKSVVIAESKRRATKVESKKSSRGVQTKNKDVRAESRKSGANVASKKTSKKIDVRSRKSEGTVVSEGRSSASERSATTTVVSGSTRVSGRTDTTAASEGTSATARSAATTSAASGATETSRSERTETSVASTSVASERTETSLTSGRTEASGRTDTSRTGATSVSGTSLASGVTATTLASARSRTTLTSETTRGTETTATTMGTEKTATFLTSGRSKSTVTSTPAESSGLGTKTSKTTFASKAESESKDTRVTLPNTKSAGHVPEKEEVDPLGDVGKVTHSHWRHIEKVKHAPKPLDREKKAPEELKKSEIKIAKERRKRSHVKKADSKKSQQKVPAEANQQPTQPTQPVVEAEKSPAQVQEGVIPTLPMRPSHFLMRKVSRDTKSMLSNATGKCRHGSGQIQQYS